MELNNIFFPQIYSFSLHHFIQQRKVTPKALLSLLGFACRAIISLGLLPAPLLDKTRQREGDKKRFI